MRTPRRKGSILSALLFTVVMLLAQLAAAPVQSQILLPDQGVAEAFYINRTKQWPAPNTVNAHDEACRLQASIDSKPPWKQVASAAGHFWAMKGYLFEVEAVRNLGLQRATAPNTPFYDAEDGGHNWWQAKSWPAMGAGALDKLANGYAAAHGGRLIVPADIVLLGSPAAVTAAKTNPHIKLAPPPLSR